MIVVDCWVKIKKKKKKNKEKLQFHFQAKKYCTMRLYLPTAKSANPPTLIFSSVSLFPLHMLMISKASSAMAAFPCSRVCLYFSLYSLLSFHFFSFIYVVFIFIGRKLPHACKFMYFLLFSLLGFDKLWIHGCCDPYCEILWYGLRVLFFVEKLLYPFEKITIWFGILGNFCFSFCFLSECLEMVVFAFGNRITDLGFLGFFFNGFQSVNFTGNYCDWFCLLGTVRKYRDMEVVMSHTAFFQKKDGGR